MAENNQIAVRENEIKHALMGVRRQVESLLSDKSRSDKFMAAALVVAQDKTLAGCRVESIVQALVGVAMSDLNVDKNIGQVYLVKYKDDVNLQIGYKGFIQLLFRAGFSIKAFPVYKTDHFKINFNGWDYMVDFDPDIDNRDEGDNEWVYENLRGVYAVAKHKDTGDIFSEFVPKNVIEKLRLTSPNQTKAGQFTSTEDKKRIEDGLPIGIWRQWYSEMACAKAVKKLSKKLPIGDARVSMAIAADDRNDMGQQVNYKKTAEDGVVVADIKRSDEPKEQQKPDLNDVINGASEVVSGKKQVSEDEQKKPAKPETKPADPSHDSETGEVNWTKLVMDAKDDEALKAVMASIPDDKVVDTFDEIPTVDMLNQCFKLLSPERQEQFGSDFSLVRDVLAGK